LLLQRAAERFLQSLDDELHEAKFDIVDTVSMQEMQGMSFNELIQKSLDD
jgi:hypothetical protein